MRASNLPNVHRFIPNAFQLRNEAAKAISSLEILGKRGGSTEPAALAKLEDFFQGCLDAVAAVSDYPASIAITPGTIELDLSDLGTQQLTVTATQLDAGELDVTTSSLFTSSAPAVATVDEDGLVTAVGVGSTTITAQYQNKFDTQVVTVVA